jgi:LPS-assembly lipoprotein
MSSLLPRPVRPPLSMAIPRRLLLLSAAVSALPGCGFALRVAPKFAFDSLRLQGSETTAVARELGKTLERSGVRVVSTSSPAGEPAQVVLTVLVDQRERSVVGQTAAGQVRELQLRTRFRFRFNTSTGKALLGDTELLLERDLSFSETAVLAKEAEEALLFRTMQSDIVQQVMRRLSAVHTL